MAIKGTHCRKCGSADVRRSNGHGIVDLLMHALFKRRPYRCRSCRARFFAADDLLGVPEVHPPKQPG